MLPPSLPLSLFRKHGGAVLGAKAAQAAKHCKLTG